MSKILIYSFKSFPYEEVIDRPVNFWFHKLNEDISKFKKIIKETSPEIILGLAKSRSNSSRFETKAVNVFNKSKTIDKEGISEYLLNYPQKGFKQIKVNKGFTHSYCNWTMYRVSQIIQEKDTKLQFIHIREEDINTLNDYLKTLQDDTFIIENEDTFR